MEIIIGRDKETGKLSITASSQTKTFGAPDSVPSYVSRQHAKLEIDDKGQLVLKNLKPSNVTYVNGLSIDSKHVTQQDTIELGPNRYLLSWEFIEKMIPQVVDIKPLEAVWNNYHSKKMEYQIAERRFNALRSATGLITMGAIVMSMIGGRSMIYFILYGLAIGITLLFTILAYVSSSKVPQKNDELDKDFKKKYVCPNPKCKHFLGYTSYDILSQNKQCPYCKTVYKK